MVWKVTLVFSDVVPVGFAKWKWDVFESINGMLSVSMTLQDGHSDDGWTKTCEKFSINGMWLKV